MIQFKNPLLLTAIAVGAAFIGLTFWYLTSFNVPEDEVPQPRRIGTPTEPPTIIPPTVPPPGMDEEEQVLGEDTSPTPSPEEDTAPYPTPESEPAPYPTPYPTPPPSQPQTYTVSMDASGFSPAVLTINLGDTVRFTNNDNKARWPASDKHPIHLDYSEFDPLQGVQTGESWSFTFERAGEWGMHDHIYPGVRGKITVQ